MELKRQPTNYRRNAIARESTGSLHSSSAGSVASFRTDYGEHHYSYKKNSKERLKTNDAMFMGVKKVSKTVASNKPPTTSLSMEWEENLLRQDLKKQEVPNKHLDTDSLVSMVCGAPAFQSGSVPFHRTKLKSSSPPSSRRTSIKVLDEAAISMKTKLTNQLDLSVLHQKVDKLKDGDPAQPRRGSLRPVGGRRYSTGLGEENPLMRNSILDQRQGQNSKGSIDLNKDGGKTLAFIKTDSHARIEENLSLRPPRRHALMTSISTESLMHHKNTSAAALARRYALPDEDLLSFRSASQIFQPDEDTTRNSQAKTPMAASMASSTTIADYLPILTFAPLIFVLGLVCLFHSVTLCTGIILGGAIAFYFMKSFSWFMHASEVKVYIPAVDSPLTDLPEGACRNMPKNINESTEDQPKEYEGWMNLLEVASYAPETYHINNTVPVFMSLDKSALKIQKPDSEIPKRAMWNEPEHNPRFLKQILIDTRKYSVELLPTELVKSRLWSKKYPICLRRFGYTGGRVPTSAAAVSLFDHSRLTSPEVLYLFARTGREKEEWFRRLNQASRGRPITTIVTELKRWAQLDIQRELKKELKKARENSLQKADTLDSKSSDNNHKRSLSDGSSASVAMHHSRNSGKALMDRDHRKLLTEYMKCMMAIMEKSSKFEPSEQPVHGSNEQRDSSSVYNSKAGSISTPAAVKEQRATSTSRIGSFKAKIMNKFENQPTTLSPSSACTTRSPSEAAPIAALHCDTGVLWVNVILQRVFFDFFHEEYWQLKMKEKLQKKLDKINLPYFVDHLVLSEINLGKNMPLIKHISQPYLSNDGLWVDSQVAYDGGVTMAIETKINLVSLKKADSLKLDQSTLKKPAINTAITDEDAEDSDESSTSSDEPAQSDSDSPGAIKVTKIFNKLKESKYFQQLANTKFVKSAMDRVSNTKLKLSVEIKYVAGTFSVNIPPPPSDRLWFGFHGNPDLILNAKPVVGEKSVNVALLSDWIEKKLTIEFQRLLIIPNMVDKMIPIMCAHYTPNLKRRTKKSRAKSTSRSDVATRYDVSTTTLSVASH